MSSPISRLESHYFLVSAHEVTEQLKSIPGVSEAKVSKQFPKSMSVEVKAQRPAAMLKRGDP